MLARLIGRVFLKPSRFDLRTQKREVLVPSPWGHVQLWRQYSASDPSTRGETQLFILRFLASRGRAELATLDPADRLPDVATEVWTMNSPGFGRTSGPTDLRVYAECAEIAFRQVEDEANGRPIWICGKSIGTAAALLVAARRNAAGLILRNAMPLRRLIARHYALRSVGLSKLVARAIPEELDSIANAQRCAMPAMFLVSREDRVVPPEYQRLVIDAYAGRKTVLEVTGGHDERTLSPHDENEYRAAVQRLAKGI